MRIINLIKKYWLLILLGLLATALTIFKLFFAKPSEPTTGITPTPETIAILPFPQIEGYQIPQQNQISIKTIDFPEKMKVYQGIGEPIQLEKAKKIAKKLNFTGDPIISQSAIEEKVYNWTEKGKYLSINLAQPEIVFITDPYELPFPKTGDLPSVIEAENKLNQQLKDLDLTPKCSLQSLKEQYLSLVGPALTKTDQQKAEVIMVGLVPSLENIPVFNQNPTSPFISSIFDRQKNQVGFEYRLNYNTFKTGEEYTLKNIDEIKQNLETEGKIVYIDIPFETDENLSLKNVTFNQIKLACFQIYKETLIQPIFVLSGQGTLADGSTTEVIAYLPAIASKWLKTPQQHFEIKDFNLPTGEFSY